MKAFGMRTTLLLCASVCLLVNHSVRAEDKPQATTAEQSAPNEPRAWTSKSGKFSVRATFLGMHEDKVRLKKENGDVIEVPLEKLGDAEVKLVKTLAEKLQAAKEAEANKEKNPFEGPAGHDEPLTAQEITKKVQGGVVLITTHGVLGEPIALGSGFVIDKTGLVATNYHVVANASSAVARFRDGTEVAIDGYRILDKNRDLALLQLKSGLPKQGVTLALQAADKAKQGDTVTAIGHPGDRLHGHQRDHQCHPHYGGNAGLRSRSLEL